MDQFASDTGNHQRVWSRVRSGLLGLAVLGGLWLPGEVAADKPMYIWAARAGGTGHDYGTAIAVDSRGNTFVTGYFRTSAKFDDSVVTGSGGSVVTGSGGYVMNGNGEADMFLAKYDRLGRLCWLRQMGGPADDYARGLAVDGEGNSYITGMFLSQTIDFGGEVVTRGPETEIFVAKFSFEGKLLWVRQASSTLGGSGNAVAVGPQGQVYVAGYFSGAAVFSDLNVTTAGYNDIFVARYTADGDIDWVRQIGGPGDDAASSLAVDGQGNVFVGGGFSDQVRFARLTSLESHGLTDGFVLKLNPDGRTVWAQRAGNQQNDFAFGVALDPEGHVYLAGAFNGTESFASDLRLHAAFRKRAGSRSAGFGGTSSVKSEGASDIFVSKYDPNGRVMWVRSMGGTKWGAPEAAYGIAVDSVGHAHITGTFAGKVVFGNNTLFSAGIADAFVAELDRDGRVVWARQAGSMFSEPQSGVAIAVDRGGNSYVIGHFRGNLALGDHVVKSQGETDIFITKVTAQFLLPQ